MMNTVIAEEKSQLTTFLIGGQTFGIDVMDIQEVTGCPDIISVPLAPSFILGLINLRGHIATAVNLKYFFSSLSSRNDEQMSVVCKINGSLVSLIVDSIGDVIEVDNSIYEDTPETIEQDQKKFIQGIYKIEDGLISLLDLDAIATELDSN